MKSLISAAIVISAIILMPASGLPPHPPKAAELAEIYISTPSGWWLQITPQGEARLGYGSGEGDTGKAPLGTFVFTTVYTSLAGVVQTNGNGRDSVVIAFHGTEDHTTQVFYAHSTKVVQSLFETARQHCTPFNRQRFDDLWSKHVPVPKQ
jgi:hypothetical protein